MQHPEFVVPATIAVAVAAAARSTWSPCGLSMLSTITPFGERARGHRYPATAAWFVAGAAAGGASLGAVGAVLAALYGVVAGNHVIVTAVLAAAALTAGAGADSGLIGPPLPLNRRQVNDRWLSLYRRWVYAGGFGWQIGSGVTTYIMTWAVFTMVLLAALTGSAPFALAVGTLFGVVRGLAVLLTASASSPERLRLLHRRMESLREPVRRAAIAVQAGGGLAAATAGVVPGSVAAVGALALLVLAWRARPAAVSRMAAR